MIKLTQALLVKEMSSEIKRVEALLQDTLTQGPEDFNALIRPLSEAGGKRLRAQLCILIAKAGNAKSEDYIRIAAAVEMLHLATLIHDDVLDQASLRRGATPIHCTKGNKVAILSGDYLFAKAFALVAEVGSVPCLHVFSRVITALVHGEFLQMEDRFAIHQGTERYLLKTQEKTGDFIEACMELGGILGDWSADQIALLKEYGHALGMSFQITDDIMDYRESKQTTGKPVGKDLEEGILTYPLLSIVTKDNETYLQDTIHAIANGADERELVEYVISQGGVDNALELEKSYRERALHALDQLHDFKGKSLLYTVIESMANRKV